MVGCGGKGTTGACGGAAVSAFARAEASELAWFGDQTRAAGRGATAFGGADMGKAAGESGGSDAGRPACCTGGGCTTDSATPHPAQKRAASGLNTSQRPHATPTS